LTTEQSKAARDRSFAGALGTPMDTKQNQARDVTYFDDIEIGRRHLVGTYVVTKADAIAFALRWEPQPYHVDEQSAASSLYGGLTLCSLQLFAICTRLFFDWPERLAVMAMLGKDQVRFPHPARPDDQLSYFTTCSEKRLSRTQPTRGIVTLLDELCTASGEIALTQQVTLLVARRGS
jgi:acyl dehydratase